MDTWANDINVLVTNLWHWNPWLSSWVALLLTLWVSERVSKQEKDDLDEDD